MKPYLVLPLSELLNAGYDERTLLNKFSSFTCKNEPDLVQFINKKAIAYDKTNFGKTYLIIDENLLQSGVFELMGYFTLAQKAIDISIIPKKRKRKMLGEYPGRDILTSIPAFLVGQLGRSDKYTHDDLPGDQILKECYHILSITSMIIGGNFVVLECRKDLFDKFYGKQDFKKMYDELNEEGLYTLFKKVDFSEYYKRLSSH